MRTVFFVCVVLPIAMFLQPAAWADGANRAQKPNAFPSLSRVKGTNLYYSAVALDTWTGKVAYLAFEGNSSTGFSRMFAWIPDDKRFGRPVEFKARNTEGNPNLLTFGELENTDSEGDEKVDILWKFSTGKQARGAGEDKAFDYVTGKTVERKWDAATWYTLNYSVKLGYAYGPASKNQDDGMPLELTYADRLPLYNAWALVPVPSAVVGTGIHAKHILQETRDPKQGRLLCQFAGFAGSTVTRAPQEGTVTFWVLPYMGQPVYSNTVTLGEFMKKGFETEVPYGWYSMRMQGFRYGRFSFGVGIPSLGMDPVPLSRSSTTTSP